MNRFCECGFEIRDSRIPHDCLIDALKQIKTMEKTILAGPFSDDYLKLLRYIKDKEKRIPNNNTPVCTCSSSSCPTHPKKEERTKELEEALSMGFKFVDSIIPQLGRVACDIGLLNDFMVKSRKLVEEIKNEGKKPNEG